MGDGVDVCVSLWLIHADVWQKQYNIAVIPQIKINKFLKNNIFLEKK